MNIDSPLYSVNPAAQVLCLADGTSKLNKGPHDEDIHRDGTLAPEHARKHRDALLGEGVGTIAAASASRSVCYRNLR